MVLLQQHVFFSRKLDTHLSETTARSIRNAYSEEMKWKRSDENDEEATVLPEKKQARPVLLGEELDEKVQLYLRKVSKGGGVVSARIAVAAARGILLSYMLFENGGHVCLHMHWAYSSLHRMHFVQRKCTTSKSKQTAADFTQLKESFLDEVVQTVTMEEIPAELILNWDQTGICMVPSTSWTMDRRGLKWVELPGANDKQQITAVFCASIVGDFLPVQLIYKGKTEWCHPKYQFPAGWHITHSQKHWSTEQTMLEYIDHIVLSYIAHTRELVQVDASAVVIMDNFKGQITQSVTQLLEDNNVHVCLLLSNTTNLLQPFDISVNKHAKAFLKRQFEQWYSDQILQQVHGRNVDEAQLQSISLSLPASKELGDKWLVEMAEHSDNPQFKTNGFVRAGISGALDQTEDEADDVIQVEESYYEDEDVEDDDYGDPEDSISDQELHVL